MHRNYKIIHNLKLHGQNYCINISFYLVDNMRCRKWQSVQVWSLRCDLAMLHQLPRLQDSTGRQRRRSTLGPVSWAVPPGAGKVMKHRESTAHRAVVEAYRDIQDSSKSGINAQSLGAEQREDNAVRAIFVWFSM